MPLKAIDKSSSPLWVRILVWILIAGLLAASLVVAVFGIFGGFFQQWEEAGNQMNQQQPIMISPEDLDPEILAELERQMAEQEQQNQQEQDENPLEIDTQNDAEESEQP